METTNETKNGYRKMVSEIMNHLKKKEPEGKNLSDELKQAGFSEEEIRLAAKA